MDIQNEIYIHEGHTKNNLIGFINNSNMDIYQPYLHTKDKLCVLITNYLNKCNHEINFYSPTFPFSTKKDFINFLGENPNTCSGADKRRINDIARNIIQFCKSGYDFNKSKYNDFDDVYDDCLKIKEHGDIFSVRTAITIFNIVIKEQGGDPIEPKISPLIHNKLQLKNTFKRNCIPQFQVKHGKFRITFDSDEDMPGDIKDIIPCDMKE